MMARDTPLFWALGAARDPHVHQPTCLAPENQRHLTALHRAVYQVYRSAWKPILYFPLAALLLEQQAGRGRPSGSPRRGRHLRPDGDCRRPPRGDRHEGPFHTGNSLGAVLIVPFLVSFRIRSCPTARRARCSMEVVAYSAGARASLCRVARCLRRSGGRSGGHALGSSSPSVRRKSPALALDSSRTHGSASTVRTQARPPESTDSKASPHLDQPNGRDHLAVADGRTLGLLLGKALKKPWLGYGSDIDPTITAEGGAKSPHNGYLSFSRAYGLPAAILYVTFGVLGIVGGHQSLPQYPVVHRVLDSRLSWSQQD